MGKVCDAVQLKQKSLKKTLDIYSQPTLQKFDSSYGSLEACQLSPVHDLPTDLRLDNGRAETWPEFMPDLSINEGFHLPTNYIMSNLESPRSGPSLAH